MNKIKRTIACMLAAALLFAPSAALARRPYGGHGHYTGGQGYSYHSHGSDIAAGVLGGILGGVILGEIFAPPVVVTQPYYSRPDPYGAGYAAGYERGARAARQQQYGDSYRRGYEDGYYSSTPGY